MDPSASTLLLAQAQRHPPRSLARRNLEMQWHDLRRRQESNVRLQIVMEGTGGEAGLGQRILDMERELIVFGARKGEQDDDDHSRILREEDVVQNAFLVDDIPTIVSVLSGSGSHSLKNLYSRRLQIACLDALWKLCHKNAPNRSRFVNCGGIPALLASTRIHAACQSFLRKATALVMSLPFYKDSNALVDLMGMAQPHKEAHVALMKRHQDDDTMDTSIATLLISTLDEQDQGNASSHIFNLIAQSVDLDLFHVRLRQPGDENGNYERLLAVKQIPVVCRDLEVLVNDPPCLRRRLLFLRTCLASYLGDTSITTDTLGAIVL